MKKRLSYFIVFIALALAVVACLDEVDLVPPDGRPESFLIQGKLLKSEETTFIEVTVQRLFNFEGFNSIVPALTQTEVTVINSQGERKRIAVADQGLYRLTIPNNDPDFPIETNQDYRLEIKTVDGVTYLSDPSMLLASPEVDTLRFKTNNIDAERTNILFESTIPLNSTDATTPRFRWRLFESFRVTEQRFGSEDPGRTCYISRNLEKDMIFLFNANLSNTDFLDSLLVYEGELDQRFAEGYYLTLILESLDQPAYEYWEQTKQLVEREGSMFDPAPGVVRSNFRNIENEDERVFGFFYAAEEEIERVFVNPALVGMPNRFCPPSAPPSPFVNVDSTLCGNCLWAFGSSLDKPDYWEE